MEEIELKVGEVLSMLSRMQHIYSGGKNTWSLESIIHELNRRRRRRRWRGGS